MNHFLKNEIIKHILNCVGVSAKGVSGRGLADPTFRLPNQEMVLTYDGSGDEAHAVYTARIDLGDSIFHGCLVDLSIDDSSEFLFGICLDDSKIMALSCDFNLPDGSVDNKFIVLDENKEMWFDVDTFTQANVLSVIDRFNYLGIEWSSCNDCPYLYESIFKLAELS